MNFLQSIDFNAGIIYNQIDKLAIKVLTGADSISSSGYVSLPCIQVFPRDLLGISISRNYIATADKERIIAEIKHAVINQFDAVYGSHLTLVFNDWNYEKQYVLMTFTISKKEKYKEMTIEDIEKALGYKVKIIGKIEAKIDL